MQYLANCGCVDWGQSLISGVSAAMGAGFSGLGRIGQFAAEVGFETLSNGAYQSAQGNSYDWGSNLLWNIAGNAVGEALGEGIQAIGRSVDLSTSGARGSEEISGLRMSGYPDGKKYVHEQETTRMVQQERLNTCSPACGRQMLLDDGFNISETEIALRAATIHGGTLGGTEPKALARALNSLDPRNANLPNPRELNVRYIPFPYLNENQAFDPIVARTRFNLAHELANGSWIAGIRVSGRTGHAIIIDSLEMIADVQMVKVRDPWGIYVGQNVLNNTGRGIEGYIPLDNFLEMWHTNGGLSIFRKYRNSGGQP